VHISKLIPAPKSSRTLRLTAAHGGTGVHTGSLSGAAGGAVTISPEEVGAVLSGGVRPWASCAPAAGVHGLTF
jgi:hypothetical protein